MSSKTPGKMRPKTNRQVVTLIAGIVITAAFVLLGIVIKTQIIDPGNTTAIGSGQLVAPTLALPGKAATQPASGIHN